MKKKSNNYAFIDGQNLYLVIQELGWKLDYKKLEYVKKEPHKDGTLWGAFNRDYNAILSKCKNNVKYDKPKPKT